MAGPGAEHPYPEQLLAFTEKMAREIGRQYVERTGKMIRGQYPASAAKLLPKLRAIYKAAAKK